MKTLITILISCSLALAASAIAQQDEQQQKPKKENAQSEKSHPTNEARPAPKPQSVPRQHAETKAPGQETGMPKSQSSESSSKPHTMTKAPGKEPVNANAGKEQVEQRKKERSAPNESATANEPSGSAPAGASEQASLAAAPQANKANPQANKLNAQAKKPDPQQVQQIKSQHANFRAQPKPQQVPAVTYNQNYRIQGSESLAGSTIRSIPFVSSGMARPRLVSIALQPCRADRWRLLLLEQRLLVSGMGLQSLGAILCLRRTDLCRSTC